MALPVMEYQDQGYNIRKFFAFFEFGMFSLFSDFFRSNLFIFDPKVEKNNMGVFSTQFLPLISILATKMLEEQNCQL